MPEETEFAETYQEYQTDFKRREKNQKQKRAMVIWKGALHNIWRTQPIQLKQRAVGIHANTKDGNLGVFYSHNILYYLLMKHGLLMKIAPNRFITIVENIAENDYFFNHRRKSLLFRNKTLRSLPFFQKTVQYKCKAYLCSRYK